MEDIIKSLNAEGFKPEENEDTSEFKPITGKYVCRIDSAGRVTGTSKTTGNPYDFRSVNIQVAEIIEGDKATNRFLKLRYNCDTDGTKRLLNDLFTAGIEVKASSDIELDEFLKSLKDNTLNVRCWVWTPDKDRDGNPIAEENRVPYQQIKIVKEFKGGNKSSSNKSKSDGVPF